ncbi:hypothetical protein O3M35_007427 [Rhynocoris fuscipes]|uniref:Shugoshin C-terminal domain-containing protein n=1 Tax=Rhynocoris fuscipes TaxID=488301 RepID=A0AAW1DAT5_9HEMI
MGKTMRVENKPVNLTKKVKMLKRRLLKQNEIIHSLEERNIELSTELNETKMSLSQMNDEYNKLLTRNYELDFQINHNQSEFEKIKTFVSSEIISALKVTGNLSEVLLNLKGFLSGQKISFDPRAESPMLSATPQPNRSEILPASSNEVKRVQATVSPMIKGIALKNPTISLRRLNPNEILAYRGESPFRNAVSNVCQMTPIQEEASTPPRTEPIRTRLGSRNQVPPLSVREASIIRDFIPEAHSEPVVRLSDVSRLLSNTSWVNVNFSTPKKNKTKEDDSVNNGRSGPSSSSETSVSGEIPIAALGTITVRKRRKALMSTSKNNADTHDNKLEIKVQMLDSSVEQMLDSSVIDSPAAPEEVQIPVSSSMEISASPEMQIPVSPEMQIPASSEVQKLVSSEVLSPDSPDVQIPVSSEVPSSSSSFLADEEVKEHKSVLGVKFSQIYDNDLKSISRSNEITSLIHSPNVKTAMAKVTMMAKNGQQSTNENILQEPSTLITNPSDECSRPKSKRIKKPSMRYLESTVLESKRSPKGSIQRKHRKKCSGKSFTGHSPSNVENVSQNNCRRASSRSKKVTKYVDEPFSSKEMQRILKKGRGDKKKK